MTVERMIELLEIEKECVLRNACGECNRYCAGCDLLQDVTELHEMYTKAIALLKAQEPRVMTAEEVQEDELVWIEVPQSDEIWPALLRESDWFDHPTWVMCGYAIARSFLHDGYGRDWRCWTSRPTDEQMEATPWE